MNLTVPPPEPLPDRWLRLRSPAVRALVLSAVLVVSGGIRLWGIDSGLPFPYHPDEPFLVEMVRQMFQTGDLNPPAWDYPSLQVYSLLAIFTLRQLLNPVLPFLTTPSMDYLVGRLLSVAYAVATIYLVYRIGRNLFGDLAGLVAATFLGFSDMHNYNSHFLMTDVPATFYVTATLALAARLFKQPSLATYAATGALAGLAAATKYPVATVFLVLPVAHVLGQRQHAFRRVGLLTVAGASAILAFAVASPYILIDSQHFLQSFIRNDIDWAASGHEGAEGNVVLTYLRWLFVGQDIPVAWLALLGFVLGIIRRNRWTLFLGVFPLVYFVSLLPWQVRFGRYLLPTLPYLSLLAGWAVVEGHRLLARRSWSARAWRAAIVLALALQLGVAADRSVVFAEEDVRTTTLDWIEANLPAGRRVVREHYTPFVPEDRYRVTALARAIDRDPAWYRNERVDYLVLSSNRFGRYFHDPERYHVQIAQYRQLIDSAQLIREFRGSELGARGIEIMIYQYSQ